MAPGLQILGLFGLLCLAAQAQRPSKGTPWSTYGRDNPLQFFSLLSQLPVEASTYAAGVTCLRRRSLPVKSAELAW